jgi:hypothetical protein
MTDRQSAEDRVADDGPDPTLAIIGRLLAHQGSAAALTHDQHLAALSCWQRVGHAEDGNRRTRSGSAAARTSLNGPIAFNVGYCGAT